MVNNIVRLKGEGFNLCVLRTDDEALELYTKWINDEEIVHWVSRHNKTATLADEKEWASKSTPNLMQFNIVVNNAMVGNCSIRIKDNVTCALGIMIGESSARDKGLGPKVIKLLIKYCFENLHAHRVELDVVDENIRAIKCYQKAGFKECGHIHEDRWFNGHWAGTIKMEILDREYFGNINN